MRISKFYHSIFNLPLGFELYRVVLRSNTVCHSNDVLSIKVLLCDCENPETDVNLQEIRLIIHKGSS